VGWWTCGRKKKPKTGGGGSRAGGQRKKKKACKIFEKMSSNSRGRSVKIDDKVPGSFIVKNSGKRSEGTRIGVGLFRPVSIVRRPNNLMSLCGPSFAFRGGGS